MNPNVLIFVTLTFFATGCATTTLKVNPAEFEVQPLEHATSKPTPEEVKRSKPRVAIFPLELLRGSDQVSSGEAEALEPSMRSELETALLDTGMVTLLDRNLALRLRGALAEAERSGKRPKALQQADSLIITQIDLAAGDREYRPATTNRKGRVIPGVCITSARVSGVLKVHDIEENVTVGIEDISGSAKDVDEAPGCADMSRAEERALFQQATKDAASDARGFLRSHFAPKGYIVEKRFDGKGWVFKVTTDGATMAEYKTVKIFDRRQSKNQLTNEIDLEVLSVGVARVTDQYGERFLWIYVDDRAVADRVRLGHLVKPDSMGRDPMGIIKSTLDL
ncbi:MAG: hypothetical protein AB8B79_05895 [Granulosicoccus sp.]